MNQSAYQPTIFEAAFRGDFSTLQHLLNSGCNVNATDKAGMTALHHACLGNQVHIADHLVQRGADVNIKDLRGHTAKDYANEITKGVFEGASVGGPAAYATVASAPVYAQAEVGNPLAPPPSYSDYSYGINPYPAVYPAMAVEMTDQEAAVAAQEVEVVENNNGDFLLEDKKDKKDSKDKKLKTVKDKNGKTLKLPILVWVDDKQHEKAILKEAKKKANVMCFKSTDEAMSFLESVPELKGHGRDVIRILENNVRIENLQRNFDAGKQLVQRARKSGFTCPIMVFCGDITYVKPIMNEFDSVLGSTSQAEAVQFVSF